MTSRELPAPDNTGPRGAAVGRATNGTGEIIHFSDDLMRGHHLYVGRVGMGKSTMLSHLTRHLMSEIASGRSDRSLVVMDPHSDLMSIVLGNVPPELIPGVKLVELGDPDRVPAVNPLDDIDFSLARLTKADFTDALLDNVIFDNADVDRAIFERTRCADCKFRGADVRNADFTRANLVDSLFNNALVGNANFTGADLTGAEFDRTEGIRDVIWNRTVCPNGIKSDDCFGDDALDAFR